MVAIRELFYLLLREEWQASTVLNNNQQQAQSTHCAMTICFKVDSNVKFLGLMMQVLHSCFGTVGRHLENKGKMVHPNEISSLCT